MDKLVQFFRENDVDFMKIFVKIFVILFSRIFWENFVKSFSRNNFSRITWCFLTFSFCKFFVCFFKNIPLWRNKNKNAIKVNFAQHQGCGAIVITVRFWMCENQSWFSSISFHSIFFHKNFSKSNTTQCFKNIMANISNDRYTFS